MIGAAVLVAFVALTAPEELERMRAETRASAKLLERFPDQRAHEAARNKALAYAKAQVRAAQQRFEEMLEEHERLLSTRQSAINARQRATIDRQLASQQSAINVQRAVLQQQIVELDELDQSYDLELSRLRRLWNRSAAY